ncbi:hypothetical protein E4T42_07458 [Aureobasidium subglaciale]|nr:hypothetical protein E4T42_07458 [Aureobasidium subglaciale]
MVIVALAGWNSGLGRVIWDALQQSEKHKGFILTRKVPEAVDTKRFAPSAFAIPYPWGSVDVLPPLKYYFEAIETLEESDLEWTVFLNGVFLDYHVMLQIKGHLAPNVFAIDMLRNLEIGNIPVSFTWSMDLAKFIVAALDLPTWEEESRVIGDEVTFNNFVDVAERIIGKHEASYHILHQY